MHHPTDRIAHTTGFVTPAVERGRRRNVISITMCTVYDTYLTSAIACIKKYLQIRKKEGNILFNEALNTFY